MNSNGSHVEDGGDCSIRPILCELGVITRPDGSAILTQGHTVVMSAVYGPSEVRMQRLQVDRAFVETIFRPKSGLPCPNDRMRETIIKDTCETAMLAALYPRTTVSVILQEMQDSGGLLACSINASCLALMDSGLAMKFLFAAVTCGITNDNIIIVDPDGNKLKDCKATLTFAFDSIDKNVIASYTTGTFPIQVYNNGLEKCRQASDFLFDFYRDIVRKYSTTL
ncbi:exosome complex component RRP46 [Neocloeon triangulifer]|uniref:exosome complex component RRP46 n=1 Tax=Neocloeon triangulifer TaxID=2078957 RepID=UPI00286EDF07|nr:exosome complex component RRP46 [Neocloeon triangulifer]XP_059472933.1 exosome complex component RRP46 [Neocloeon triangulifer]